MWLGLDIPQVRCHHRHLSSDFPEEHLNFDTAPPDQKKVAIRKQLLDRHLRFIFVAQTPVQGIKSL